MFSALEVISFASNYAVLEEFSGVIASGEE